MKKILAILITILSLQGFTQGWAEVGSIWHYSQRTVNPDFISYTTLESIADTIIEGIVCKKIIRVIRAYDAQDGYADHP